VKLVLDEMWSPAIAEQLRRRGHDAIAAQDQAHRPRYGGITDELLFERAQEDERAIVTDNVDDYLPLVADCEQRRVAHHGVVFCSSRQFDRSNPRIVGLMVEALDAFLRNEEAAATPFNGRHWLRRTT
jgi:predicted nuclease of predicted toxin-antitoxin system